MSKKTPERADEDLKYSDFLKEADKEREMRSAVLKPGKVQPIHLSGNVAEDISVLWANIQNKPSLYTQAEVDALLAAQLAAIIVLLAAQDELSELNDVSLSSPSWDDFLRHDGVNWKNYNMNLDFDEGVMGETIGDFWQLLKKLVKIEDAFDGVLDIDEGVMA